MSDGFAGSDLPLLVLVTGPEEVLVDRAVAAAVSGYRRVAPDLEVVRISATDYEAGSLTLQASPSLFGESKVVVVDRLDEARDDLQAELLTLLGTPDPVTALIVTHRSGNRGKKVLDALKKAEAHVIRAPAVKYDREKADFVAAEFRAAERRATPQAIHALVEAVGKDLRELVAACQQLIADTTGEIDERLVETYHGGKVEATGFRVADAAIAGNTGEALRLLRHAIAVGVDPVPVVAVLASQLRQLVRVGAAGRGRSADIAKALSMAPWQVEKAWRALNGWEPDALGRSIRAVAVADTDVKGGGRDPVYAVERAILTIAAERRGRDTSRPLA